jgi:hypothetical protein
VASSKAVRSGGKVSSLSNVAFKITHKDPGYTISAQNDLTRGATGLLGVFSLLPNTSSSPKFYARIDDGNPGKRKKYPN